LPPRWAAAFLVRVLFAFLYWVDKPLTHDELEYLSLAETLPTGTGSPTTRTSCRTASRNASAVRRSIRSSCRWWRA
jgi:hypothetical protein